MDYKDTTAERVIKAVYRCSTFINRLRKNLNWTNTSTISWKERNNRNIGVRNEFTMVYENWNFLHFEPLYIAWFCLLILSTLHIFKTKNPCIYSIHCLYIKCTPPPPRKTNRQLSYKRRTKEICVSIIHVI